MIRAASLILVFYFIAPVDAFAKQSLLACTGWNQGADSSGHLYRSEKFADKPTLSAFIDVESSRIRVASTSILLLSDEWEILESRVSKNFIEAVPKNPWHDGEDFELMVLSRGLGWMNIIYSSDNGAGIHTLKCSGG